MLPSAKRKYDNVCLSFVYGGLIRSKQSSLITIRRDQERRPCLPGQKLLFLIDYFGALAAL